MSRSTEVERIAAGVLSGVGLRIVGESVLADGSSIRVTVASAGICGSAAEAESQIAAQLEHVVPSLHSVAILVAGSDETLTQYESGSCGSLTLPSGPGRVVLTLKGSGFSSTERFTVHSDSWTIAYVNQGRAVSIFPLKGSTPTRAVVVTQPRTAGAKIEHGAGTYLLRISGLGSWIVEVRDGA